MILVGRYLSPFVRRTAITLRLYGIAFEHKPLSTMTDMDAIKKLNPVGRVPVLVLDRLAVDRRARGRRLGSALLQDAVKRSIGVSHDAGVRALLVHAIDEAARGFYAHYGFAASPIDPMTLMLGLPERP